MSGPPKSNMDTLNEQLTKENEELKQRIKLLENIPKHGDSLSLKELIERNTPYSVIKATPEQKEKVMVIAQKAQLIMKDKYNNKFPTNSSGKETRVNECGNHMEKMLDEASNDIINPLTDKGKQQDTGYPDRELKDELYLEIKLMDSEKEESTYRSFYMSTFNKINKSMPHLVVAFKHTNCVLTNDEPLVIDLYDKVLKLKCEWNTHNKGLYYIPKKPDYTLESLDTIKDGNLKKGEKRKEFSQISKKYGLNASKSAVDQYDNLVGYLNTWNESNP